ncbi:CCHC-type domain-containing protein [Trichonephila clavipes]|nr:CCHC-type domain-containing protein [Trichonephila clavipes]
MFSQEQRMAIVEFYFAIKSNCHVINAFQPKYPGETAPNSSTITLLVQRFRDTGSVANKKRSGRASKVKTKVADEETVLQRSPLRRPNGGAHRPSEERLGEDPLKWLKEYDRVANFNKWDDMMCLDNVYFFLDGTARQWYVNNEDALDSWEAFKNGLSGLFGDRQKYTRRAEEQLKCRAQRSGESTQSYIQSVLGLCQEVNPLMREDEKVSHLMKDVAEDIYQALLTREINDTASFIKWCNYIEDMKQKRVGRPRFERLPNVVPVASLTDETDLVSLIRTIVREVHRLFNQTQESWGLRSPILRRDRSRRS